MHLTALIVDDEPLAREGLAMLLLRDPDFDAVHEAKDGPEAVAAIRKLHPDIVFLDVQMPELDGLGVIAEIGADDMPATVFVTAYDQYAIRAFEINAVDYLLKPVTGERFARCLERIKRTVFAKPAKDTQRILSLLETMTAPRRPLKRLAVRSTGKTTFVDVDDIDWIEAAENYVELHIGRSSHLVHTTLNNIEKALDPDSFVRIHRSIIVNSRKIKELQPALHGEYVVILADGVRLQSGRIYNDRLRALAANPF
jgi:two-component system, LytTR family, response regulator